MPRPIGDQVVVLTGASYGVGRETALELARRGAAVILAARSEQALQEAAKEVERVGGTAHVQVTDVGEWAQVEALAQAAVDRFGRIDTWVNNAATNVYAMVEQTTIEEIERVIQVNLVGAIYGMKAAVPQMRRQGQGTIINVGSVESRRAVPLQAPYVAAKQGLKGFTDTLRMELQHERAGIAVTLVLPASINTPLFTHARSKLGTKPHPIPPIYEPQVVAEAIAFLAERPRREVIVGGAGKLLTVGERLAPALVDRYMVSKGRMFEQQKSGEPDDGEDNLFAPIDAKESASGEFGQKSKSSAPFTRYLELHPNRERAFAGGLLLGALVLVRRIGR